MIGRRHKGPASVSLSRPLLPQPGYLLYTYAVTSAQRHNSSNEGFVHMPDHLLTWTLPSTRRFLPPSLRSDPRHAVDSIHRTRIRTTGRRPSEATRRKCGRALRGRPHTMLSLRPRSRISTIRAAAVEKPSSTLRGGTRMTRRGLGFCSVLALVISLLFVSPQGGRPTKAQAQGSMPDAAALLAAANNSKEWLIYGHDYTNDRYSGLDQISASNVSQLAPRWIFQTGIVASFETTPVVSNGVMYITTAYNHLFALNARTGKQIWRYDHKLGGAEIYCCGPVNRGVGLGSG